MARACADSTYFELTPGGLLTIVPGSLGFQDRLTYTTPGSVNFDKTLYPTATWIYAEAIGGGGGGAGASGGAATGSARGGGSGGTYSASWINVATLAALTPVTVGGGGAGGGVDLAGSQGGTSSFGTGVVAPGGFGSQVSMAVGTTGTDSGAPSSNPGLGQLTKVGQPGGNAIMISATNKLAGTGGQSGYNGAGGLGPVNNAPGAPGYDTYGGGGSGAAAFNASWSGGAGAGGRVIVTVYS